MMRFESIWCFYSKVFLLSHGVFFLSSGKQLLPKTNRVFFSKKSSSAPWVPSLCRGCCPWSLDKFPSRTDLIARQSECVDPLTIAQHFQHMHSVPSSQFPSQKIAHLNPKPKTKPNPKPPTISQHYFTPLEVSRQVTLSMAVAATRVPQFLPALPGYLQDLCFSRRKPWTLNARSFPARESHVATKSFFTT